MAKKFWTGGAAAVAQVTTITVGGTPASGNTATIKVGGKSMAITGSSGVSTATADWAAELIASFNASSTTSPAPGTGFARSTGGQSIGEFQEITATVNASTITLTGAPGIPFTATAAVTGGGVTLTVNSNTTEATGPNDLANAENYLGGSLLTGGDTLVCDRGSNSIKWNLAYYRDNTIQFNLIVTPGFRGDIGLADVYANDDETVTHPEYRDKRLELYSTSSATSVLFLPGTDSAVGAGIRRIDADGQSLADMVVQENSLHNAAVSMLEVVGGQWTNVIARCGRIYIDPEGSAPSANMAIQTKLTIGARGDNDNLLTVDIGDGLDFSACDYVWHRSGNTTCRSHVANTGGTQDFNITGGKWTWALDDAGTQSRDAVIEAGGTLAFTNRGNLANIHVGNNATLDVGSASSITIGTLVYRYAGCTIYNNSGAIASSSFYNAGCNDGDITYVGPHNTQNAQTLPGAVSV